MDVGYLTRGVMQPLREEDADRPALSLETDATWTYRELHGRSNRYANRLLALGASPGDRVALLLHNALEYVALYLAVTKIGCIAVRLNFRLGSEELEYALNDSGATVLCVHDSLLDRIEPIRNATAVRHYVAFTQGGERIPEWAAGQDHFEASSPDDPAVSPPGLDAGAMLMYTSGTTGRPKGALWTHGNTLWIAAMEAVLWQYSQSTVAMTTGPLYHVGGFEDLLLPALFTGGHAVMSRSSGFSIERALGVMEHHRVTDCFLFPFMIYDAVNLPTLPDRDLSSLRRVVTGGSSILPWAVRKLRTLLPEVGLNVGYGLTEGGAISTVLDPRFAEEYPDCVGRPLPMTEIRIVRDDGSEASPGQDGEIWVRSPSVSQGYWNKPEATAETFVDGFCRTGDAGAVVGPGLLKITGRRKDMINSGGENIYPAEIEAILTEHPSIKDAAVIAVPDPRFQEAVCAVLTRQPGASISADEVIAYCRDHLAGYKKPRHIVFMDELPRNPTGKILKYVLRDRYRHLGAEESSAAKRRNG
jgi:fatty-acyl-CoA synthase